MPLIETSPRPENHPPGGPEGDTARNPAALDPVDAGNSAPVVEPDDAGPVHAEQPAAEPSLPAPGTEADPVATPSPAAEVLSTDSSLDEVPESSKASADAAVDASPAAAAATAVGAEGMSEPSADENAVQPDGPAGATNVPAAVAKTDGAEEAGSSDAEAIVSDDALTAAGSVQAAAPGTPPRREHPPGLSPAQTAAKLAEMFPALFAGPPKPLKLRIQSDIQLRAPGVFTKRVMSFFLSRHTTTTPYLKALVAETQRYDLDGQPAGEVTDEHRQAATEELARRRQIVEARRAAERAARGERAPAGDRPPRRGPRPDRVATARVGEPGSAQPGPEANSAAPETATNPGANARPPRGEPRGEQRVRGPLDAPGQRPPRRDGPRPPRAEGQAPGGPERRPDNRPQRPPRHGDGPQGPRSPSTAGQPAPRRHESGIHGGPRDSRPNRQDNRSTGPQLAGRPVEQRPPREFTPTDPAQRDRAFLLRAWETSSLTKANFCALKRLSEAEFDAQLDQARQERGSARGQ